MSDYVNMVSVYGSDHWNGRVFVSVSTHIDGEISGGVDFKLTPVQARRMIKELKKACKEVESRMEEVDA